MRHLEQLDDSGRLYSYGGKREREQLVPFDGGNIADRLSRRGGT